MDWTIGNVSSTALTLTKVDDMALLHRSYIEESRLWRELLHSDNVELQNNANLKTISFRIIIKTEYEQLYCSYSVL